MNKRVFFSMFMVVMMLLSGLGFSSAQAKSPGPGKPIPQPTPAAKAKSGALPDWAQVKPIPVEPVEDSPSVPGELIVGFSPALAAADLTVQSENAANSVGAAILSMENGKKGTMQTEEKMVRW